MRKSIRQWPVCEDEPWEVETRKPRKKRIRKPTLSSVAKQAARAGIEVAKYEVDAATGKIVVIVGEPATTIPAENAGIDASEWN